MVFKATVPYGMLCTRVALIGSVVSENDILLQHFALTTSDPFPCYDLANPPILTPPKDPMRCFSLAVGYSFLSVHSSRQPICPNIYHRWVCTYTNVLVDINFANVH